MKHDDERKRLSLSAAWDEQLVGPASEAASMLLAIEQVVSVCVSLEIASGSSDETASTAPPRSPHPMRGIVELGADADVADHDLPGLDADPGPAETQFGGQGIDAVDRGPRRSATAQATTRLG
jgi:hypothetical protein